ncbi:MAG: HEAT repeat domain-containing protein [Chloroflexota bacterium]
MSTEFDNALKHIQSDDQIAPSILYGFSVMTNSNFSKFQQAWPAIPDKRREEVVTTLVEIAEHSFEVNFEPIFILGLDDSNPDVQSKAIVGLWESDDPGLIPVFVHLLKTSEAVAVRTTAGQGLGQYIYLGELEELEEEAYAVAKQALLEAIRRPDEDIEVVRRAIEAIAYSSDDGISQIIESAYYHDDERMQVSGIFAMGRHGDSNRWSEIVINELDSREPKIRFEAVRAAGELDLKGAVSKLIKIVELEADSEIQQSAVWSLGQIGGDEAQALLEMLMQAEDTDEALYSVAEEAMDELMLWRTQELEDFFEYSIGGDDEDDIHIVDLNGKSH